MDTTIIPLETQRVYTLDYPLKDVKYFACQQASGVNRLSSVMDKADIDQAALAKEGHQETIGNQLMQLVLVLACMLSWIPEIALNLGHNGAHSRKERCQGHLVAVSRVDWLTRFREDQKVFSYLVKLLQIVLNLDIDAFWVDVIPFQEKLYRIHSGRWSLIDLRLSHF